MSDKDLEEKLKKEIESMENDAGIETSEYAFSKYRKLIIKYKEHLGSTQQIIFYNS